MKSLELRIFKEVTYIKSISKAGYVQSNITAHIKKFEAELNTTLLIKHNKWVNLTKEGEKLLYQAEKITNLLDNTSKYFKNTTKSLNIGATQSIAGYLLPQCLVEYQNKFPNISIAVHTFDQNNLIRQLINGQVDCIITNSSYNIEQAKQIFKYKEDLMIITPNLCKSIEDIIKFLIIVNNIKSCPYRKILLNWWYKHQATLPKIIELDTVEGILNTVAIGGGVSLLPKSTLKARENISSFYVEELQSVSVYMWVLKDKSPSDYFALKNIIMKQYKNL